MMGRELPDWLIPYISTECPHCGAPIANNDALTDRCCSNSKCPEHMAHKIDVLAKRFGIKNFGVASARDLIRRHGFIFHTEVIPYWFAEKPALYLYEIGEITLIKGHQKKWREYCEGLDSMVHILSKRNIPEEVIKNYTWLVLTESFCQVRPRLTGAKLNVMMSGSFGGYRSRTDFLKEMNDTYGDICQLVDIGKRKTGVNFLIKEEFTADHEKSAIASEMGIPVVTPGKLKERLQEYRTYMNERRETDVN